MELDAMILVFWMVSSKPTVSLSSFTFIKRLFSSSLLSAIGVMSSSHLRLFLSFLPAILIPACASSSLASGVMDFACMVFLSYSKKLHAPQRSRQHCLQQPGHGSNQSSIERWMDKEVVRIYGGILLTHKKEKIWVSWIEVDEPRAYYAQWSKSEREKQI